MMLQPVNATQDAIPTRQRSLQRCGMRCKLLTLLLDTRAQGTVSRREGQAFFLHQAWSFPRRRNWAMSASSSARLARNSLLGWSA